MWRWIAREGCEQVEFRLLGDLQLCVSGRLLDVGQPRQQAVLAVLLVEAGRPVPAATLVDRLWGKRPPTQARNVLYSHLSRIRRMLAEATAAAGETPVGVEHRPAGYLLAVDARAVDLHRFQWLVEQARVSRRDDVERAGVLREALGLWRGTALAGIPGEWAAGVRDRFWQQRLDAAIGWAEAELRLGRPDLVLSRVPDLIAEYPLAEPLEGLLMRALYGVGREAEALSRYTAVRQRLVEELGVEPGAELRGLHQLILRGDLPAIGPTRAPVLLSTDGTASVAGPAGIPGRPPGVWNLPPRNPAG